jgi:hypothetical protein
MVVTVDKWSLFGGGRLLRFDLFELHSNRVHLKKVLQIVAQNVWIWLQKRLISIDFFSIHFLLG